MASKLNSSDKKDLEKYSKYLVFKSIQVIVQSRLGERLQTDSKAFSSGSDWFNLTIKDSSDVFAETKKVYSGGFLPVGQSVCIEISVKLSDGEGMLLEIWWLSMTDQTDSNAHVSYTIYNRMSTMLRSALCVSRITPAYRLSRKQGPDSYVICYRICSGEPQLHFLGGEHQVAKVGSVPTPAGTIVLSVAYRTKMLISPQHSCKDMTVDLRDDHFTNEPVHKITTTTPGRPCANSSRRDRKGSTSSEASFSTSPPPGHTGHIAMATSPVSHHLTKAESASVLSDEDALTSLRAGAFASRRASAAQLTPASSEAVPFMSLLLQSRDDRGDTEGARMKQYHPPDDQGHEDDEEGDDSPDRLSGSASSRGSRNSVADDFVMVPNLKAPFASTDGPADLNQFYHECQTAPTLLMFDAAQPSIADSSSVVAGNLNDQLAAFDASAREFDDFVSRLPAHEL